MWKNYTVPDTGAYTRRKNKPTIILKVVADYDLWIWPAYIGFPRNENNFGVILKYNVFSLMLDGQGPSSNFTIMGHEYSIGYLLCDGIYPQWSDLIKDIISQRWLCYKGYSLSNKSQPERMLSGLLVCYN